MVIDFIDIWSKQMAKKRLYHGFYLLVITIGLVFMSCEYNFFEKGGDITIVNKTTIDYYVSVNQSKAILLSPGSSKSWNFSEDGSILVSYYPSGSYQSSIFTTEIKFGVEKILNLVYDY
jgi:hypothetical protein